MGAVKVPFGVGSKRSSRITTFAKLLSSSAPEQPSVLLSA